MVSIHTRVSMNTMASIQEYKIRTGFNTGARWAGMERALLVAMCLTAFFACHAVTLFTAQAKTLGQHGALSAVEEKQVDAISAALKKLQRATGRFQQKNPDGKTLKGTFYLWRPNRILFDYGTKDGRRVVADGTWVVVRENKGAVAQRYPLSFTPLAFILGDDVNLRRDTTIHTIKKVGDFWRVDFQDAQDNVQGRMVAFFDATSLLLRKWAVIDMQNQVTEVTLYDISLGGVFKPSLFIIQDDKPPVKSRRRR